MGYNEPLQDFFVIKFQSRLQIQKSTDTRATYDFNNGLNIYSDFNDLLSNSIISSTSSVTPMVGVSIRKEKNIRGNISMGTEIINFNNQSDYLSNKTTVNKTTSILK